MIKKLFTVLLITVMGLTVNAQSVGIVGDFNGWGNDVVMTTTDDENYTAQVTFVANGNGKFRQDAAWTVNWGSAVWPCGTGTQGGANIPYLAGTWDVTFVKSTGAYCFTAVQTNFDTINLTGGFNSDALPGEAMVTTDGITYLKQDFHFTAANVKFHRSAPTVANWGGTAFPSGTAVVNGGSIPLTTGFYNANFNNTTLAYNFVQVPVSLIGSGVVDWDTDVYGVSTDGGVTFTWTDVELFAGEVKFRTNTSWGLNWGAGGTNWPCGTGSVGGSTNIPTQAGIYNVTFNRITGEYCFTCTANCADVFSFAGTNMSTTDGITYTLNNLVVTAATTGLQFTNTTSSQVYGGTAFPSGTATLGGAALPVVPGFYNVTFNNTTLAYAFTVVPVGLIGSAASGWDNDVDMVTADNGITYTLTNYELFVGDAKFRTNDSWTFSWGGIGLVGVGVVNGPDNIAIPADGFYDISLNTHTGAYSFTNLSADSFNNNLFAIYPNPATDMIRIAGEFDQVQIFNISGQLVKSYTNNDRLSVADLNAGIYMVKVTGEAGASVKKLIKK